MPLSLRAELPESGVSGGNAEKSRLRQRCRPVQCSMPRSDGRSVCQYRFVLCAELTVSAQPTKRPNGLVGSITRWAATPTRPTQRSVGYTVGTQTRL